MYVCSAPSLPDRSSSGALDVDRDELVVAVDAGGGGAVAARWGGINEHNAVVEVTERGYFSVWCHQEDAARFVHACYESYLNGSLPSGAHYFVISDNDYNIFDIETPRTEIGYQPVHNSEVFYK